MKTYMEYIVLNVKHLRDIIKLLNLNREKKKEITISSS